MRSGSKIPAISLPIVQLLLAKTRLRAIPVDAQGIRIDVGLRVSPTACAAFVTLPVSDGRPAVDAASTYIVEDDYVSEFRYSGPPLASLQGLDEDDRVIYVGTLSKALFPGLRLGYAVVPLALLPAFFSARYLIDRQPPRLYQP
jgi:GntR family transcriptional regulator / MocR family aminotransferase